MWSGPRNVSTALMYSFGNRPDMHVVDEPFYGPYLRLTDGGHFENMGVYELVRRRMKLIIVVDGGADPGLVEAFFANPWYSPTLQTALVSAISEFDGIEGRGLMIERAAVADVLSPDRRRPVRRGRHGGGLLSSRIQTLSL